jgi:hypothetical protein
MPRALAETSNPQVRAGAPRTSSAAVRPELWAARVGPGHAAPFHCGCCHRCCQVTPLPQSTVGERGGAGLSVSRSCASTGRRPGSHWRPPRELSGVCASSVLRAGAYAVAASDVLAHTMLYTIRRLTPSMPWWAGKRRRRAASVDGCRMYARREANTWATEAIRRCGGSILRHRPRCPTHGLGQSELPSSWRAGRGLSSVGTICMSDPPLYCDRPPDLSTSSTNAQASLAMQRRTGAWKPGTPSGRVVTCASTPTDR